MEKVIITVLGKDTVGIIANVCTYLAAARINILDINQTIVQDYFHMMMIADITQRDRPLETIMSDLDALGEKIGVKIRVQREEIFTGMHRI